MIQRLQNSNLNFKSSYSPVLQATINSSQNTQQSVVEVQEEPKKSFSIKETYAKAKRGITNTIKGFNNVTSISGGVIQGIVGGLGAGAFTGLIGNACIQAKEGNGLGTFVKFGKSILSDLGNAIVGVGKFAKNLITEDKALYKQIGEALDIRRFYGKKEIKNGEEIIQKASGFLKGNKAIGAAATMVALGVLAFSIIHGKIKANQKNADLDHKTNQGHV